MAGEIKPLFDEQALKQLDSVNKYLDDISLNIAKLNQRPANVGNFKDASLVAKEFEKTINELSKADAKLTVAQTETGKSLVKLRAETARANAETRKEAKALADGTVEYQKKRDKMVALQKAAKELAATQGILSKAFKDAAAAAKQQADEISEIDRATGDYSSTVGRYNQEITKALQSTNIFGGSFDKIITGFTAYRKVSEEVTQNLKAYIVQQNISKGATDASVTSLQRLRIAIIATGVGVFVALLGTLVAAFLSTQRGVDALNRVLEPLKAILATTWGVIQDLAKGLVDAFKAPGKFVDDLLLRLQPLSQILKLLNEAKFGQAAKAFKDLGLSIKDSFNNAVVSVGKVVDKGKEIQQLKEEIEEIESREALNNAQRVRQEKELQEIAKNRNATLKQREDAFNKILALAEEEAKEQQSIVDKKIRILEIEQSFNDTKRVGAGSDKELNELLAERERIQGSVQEKRLEFQTVINLQTKEEQDRIKAITSEEQKRLAKIQELGRTEIEQAQFKRDKLIEELKLNKDIASLNEDEIKALTKINDEYNKQVESINAKNKASILGRAEGLLKEQKELETSIETLKRYNEQASPENQALINQELQFYAERLEDVKAQLTDIGALFPTFISANQQLSEELAAQQAVFSTMFDELEAKYPEGIARTDEYYKELAQLQKNFTESTLALTIATLEEQLLSEDIAADEKLEIEKRLFELKQQLRDKDLEAYKKKLEDEKKATEDAEQIKQEIIKQSVALAQEIFSSSLNLFKENQAVELEEFKFKENEKLSYASQLLEQGAITQEEFLARESRIKADIARKEAETKRKAAIADKAGALFNIALSTARGIMAALGSIPPNPILAGFIGATGAIQTAFVAARPIPKFKDGGKTKISGLAEFGEAGREIVKLPTGDSFLAENRMISWLPKGTEIFSNPKTEKMLADGSVDVLKDINRKVGKKQPTPIVNVYVNSSNYIDYIARK